MPSKESDERAGCAAGAAEGKVGFESKARYLRCCLVRRLAACWVCC